MPAEIRRAILAAAPHAIEIGDRRAAILAAIAELRRGDLLVIAGKGHETGQIVGSDILPFDDVVVAGEAVRSLGRARFGAAGFSPPPSRACPPLPRRPCPFSTGLAPPPSPPTPHPALPF